MKTEQLKVINSTEEESKSNLLVGYNVDVDIDISKVDVKTVILSTDSTISISTESSPILETHEGDLKPDLTTFNQTNVHDEDGEVDDTDEEMQEIDAILNKEDEIKVNLLEVKPVVIPIPIIVKNPAEDNDGDGANNDIIIKFKRKPGGYIKPPNPSICTICNAVFPNSKLFQEHMSTLHADKRPFPCSHCGKRFAKTTQLIKHETIHDPKRFEGEAKFTCDICGKGYHIKESLESHVRVAHKGIPNPKRVSTKVITVHRSVGVKNHRQPKKELKLFKCPYCDLKFEMRCLIRKHLLCHTKEKNYECTECGQTCATRGSLTSHIRTRHLSPKSVPRPYRPKFMENQPCPCTVCGKVFKTPSLLRKHLLNHTGENPHECLECGKRFRLLDGLKRHQKRHRLRQEEEPSSKNDMEQFKCLICGKGGYNFFTEYNNHRTKAHRHIPRDDPDKEKPFGCGICGKPYYTKMHAIICTVLKHDPTSLEKKMFKFKCKECPEERLGYHSSYALRKHWEVEHIDKPFPVQYRRSSGMYDEDNKAKEEIPLPVVNANRERKLRLIQEGGKLTPEEKEQFKDIPLYVEFDLLPFDENERFKIEKKRNKKSDSSNSFNVKCEICGVVIKERRNLNRHLKTHDKVQKNSRKQRRCRSSRGKVGRPTMTSAEIIRTKKSSVSRANFIFKTVNVNDTDGIKTILGNRKVTVVLPKIVK